MPTFLTDEAVNLTEPNKIPLILSLSKYLRINLVFLVESILPSLRPDQLSDLREKLDRSIPSIYNTKEIAINETIRKIRT